MRNLRTLLKLIYIVGCICFPFYWLAGTLIGIASVWLFPIRDTEPVTAERIK